MRDFKLSFLKTAFLSCILFIFSNFISTTTFCQSMANYAGANFSATSGTFTPLSGGTTVPSLLVDDVASSFVPIGFTFVYMGVPYTQVRAGSDGYLSFGATGSSITNNLATGTTVARPVIAPFWDDMDGRGTGAQASYLTTGSAPNRVFTFQWLNWGRTGVTTPQLTFQVKLYEADGKIDFVFRQESAALGGTPSASIGLSAITTGSGNYVSLNNAGATPTTSTSTETNTISTKPANGQTYTFLPPNAIAGTAPSGINFTGVGATTMTVNWTDNTSNETGFALYNSTDGVNFAYVANVAAGITTYTATGLTPGTTYHWQVFATTEGTGTAAGTGSQATSAAATYYWVGSATAEFNTAGTWNTASDGTGSTRSTPLTTDVLIIDGAGTVAGAAITGGTVNASASIGQLKITSNTPVTLTGVTSTRTLTITGGSGDDFEIQAASTLTLNGATAIAFVFTGTGNTGNIAGTLTFGGSTSNTLNTTGGTGTLVTVTNSGIINLGVIGLTSSTSTLAFANGSNCNMTGTQTTVPLATWGATSNLNITGIVGGTSVTNGVQTFGNLTYNCSGATGTMSFFTTSTTAVVQGNLTIQATNSGIFRATTSGSVSILGNLILTAGTFQVSSSGGTVNVTGNVNVNGGSFDISQSGASNLRVAGNFIQTAGTIAQTSSTGTLEFNGSSAQTLTLVPGSHGTNVINVRVNNAAGVDLTSAFSIRNLTISRGNLTGTGSLTYNGTTSVLTYNSTTGNQTANAIEFPSSSGPSSLTINNSNASPNNTVTVPFSRTLVGSSGVLTFTSGILDNSTYTLTLSNTATGAISGGSATTFAKGAIERSLPANLVSGSTYNFPVGKGSYNPLALVNPTTNAGGTVTLKAEIFDTNAGGTAGSNMGSLNTDRYWAASITAGASNFTNTSIRLTDASVMATSAIASSATLNGAYDIVGGTSPTIVVGTSVTSVAPAATSLPGFFVVGTKSVNMAYTSSTTTQTITTSVPQNTTNAQIIGIQVVTGGNSNPINATSFTFNANGTTDINDITNAKLYYTGTSSTFATTTLVGTATPTIAAYQIVGTQTLAEGINYFWLTYDISPTAIVNNVIDGECTVVQVASVDNTPTVTAPSGTRTIVVGAVTIFPFTDDFETGNLNKWITVNGSQTNKWHAGTATNNGGSNASYISNNSGIANAYTTTSTSIVHFYRDITFPASGSYRLKFDWKGNGESSFDDLRVFFIDVTTTPIAGTSLSSGQIGSNYVSQSSWQSVDLAFPSGYLGTTKRLVFSWRNDDSAGSQPPSAIDNISVYLETDMAYSSSNSTQTVTTSINAASTNQQIIGIQVVTTGSLNPLTLSKLVLNATGTTSGSDIANAKIFYTGVSSTFATTTQFGSTIATPTTTNFDVTGTQVLAQGTNYFWLTYDINATAVHNNVVDGECVSITAAGTDYTPTTTAPSGSRSIVNKTLTSIAGVQASTAITVQGATNQQVLRLDFVVAGPSGGSLLLNSLDATYTGTLASDIAANGVKLFTTSTTTFSTTTPLGTAQSISGGIASFTGLNFNLPTGTSYVWVAFDINIGATINNVVDTKITVDGINVGGATFNATEIDPAGSRTIRGPLAGDYEVGVGFIAPGYVTLTAAISDLNALGVSASVRFLLKDATYNTASGEVFPLVINSITGASAINTITIQPKPGTVSTVTGSAIDILELSGADHVIIDGLNTGGSSLSFINTNTATGTSVITISSLGAGLGATNNTIKNCTLENGTVGSSTVTNFGIYAGLNTGAVEGPDNDNLTIQNNTIRKTTIGIQIVGGIAAGQQNDDLLINNNIIGDAVVSNSLGRIGIFVGQATNAMIKKNTIMNAITSSASITATNNATGIAISTGVTNTTIDGNNIKDIRYNSTNGYGGKGLDINTGNAASNLTISNNMISNIMGDGWSNLTGDAIVGLRIGGTTGGVKVYNNTVNLGSGIFAGNTSGTQSAAFFVASGVTALDVRNNIFVTNLQNSNVALAKSWSINSAAPITAFTNIDFNDYAVSGTQGILGFIGSDRTTLAAIQTGFGQNTNSLNVLPEFLSSTDLHLTIANPSLDNAATPIVGLTKDIDDNDRNTTTPDIGADEFKSCATVTSPDDSGTGTLRAAITCVAENGKVFYDQPTTTTTILTAPLTIDKNVTIQGLSDVARPEITTDPAAASGIIINVDKTLTLQNVDIKSTNPAQTFSGAGNVSITGLTISKP
jgi:hypothetical protein